MYFYLFYFFKKNNFYFLNFLFINSFKIDLRINILKKNNFNNLYLKSSIFYNKNNFLLKYLKCFNSLYCINKNFLQKNNLYFFYKYKNQSFYIFNRFNYLFVKKIINIIFDISWNKKNFVFFDKSFKNVLPIYNYIFGFKNLLIYKNYFFIKYSFFSYKHFFFLYKSFLNIFDIILIVILDYFYFNKQFKLIKNINLPVVSLIPIETYNTFIDFPFSVSIVTNFEKFIFLNLISQTFLISYNYKNYLNKLEYLKLFYKFYLLVQK